MCDGYCVHKGRSSSCPPLQLGGCHELPRAKLRDKQIYIGVHGQHKPMSITTVGCFSDVTFLEAKCRDILTGLHGSLHPGCHPPFLPLPFGFHSLLP